MIFCPKLYRRRRDIVEKYAPLKHHLGILDLLGPQGMSSDESLAMPNIDGRAYTYLHSDWRADEVGTWLEDLDTVYLFDRASEGDKRGAYPHMRRREQGRRMSTRSKPVKGLPVNAYREDWLRTRVSAWVKDHLRPLTQHYIFSNDVDFIRLAIAPSYPAHN